MLYDSEFVHNLLPQKAPFAFVDEVLELQKGDESAADEALRNPKITAVLHMTGKEAFFAGHFPQNPVMPGVIQIESMAQAATLLTQLAKEKESAGRRPAFIGVENCKFRAAVVPPADLTIVVEMIAARRTLFKYSGKIFQGETLVCEAEFSAAMIK
ncbi:3-hydroxyacyl-ACP dehydratase FabZ family protein [Fibrobacter sp.]|uniref:3-hydroxyacyl-ACP dehydratase FabZ family protein n=1 Tax=Fibrobacter sp. TaxID=35828 RepID=UPI0038906101